MTATEREILLTLTELETAVRTLRTASPKPNLLTYFSRLDDLAAALPGDASPELRHYLQKKSYEKARLWLEGRQAEKGSCGH